MKWTQPTYDRTFYVREDGQLWVAMQGDKWLFGGPSLPRVEYPAYDTKEDAMAMADAMLVMENK